MKLYLAVLIVSILLLNYLPTIICLGQNKASNKSILKDAKDNLKTNVIENYIKNEKYKSGVMGYPSLFKRNSSINDTDKLSINSSQNSKNSSDNINNNTKRSKRQVDLENDSRLEWKFPIHYKVIPPVNEKIVDRGLYNLMIQTCIKFKKVSKFTGPGLRYFRGEGCWSFVGKMENGKPQNISIGIDCEENGLIHHETLHALGLEHQMSRPDRDKYINIRMQNVKHDSLNNFIIEPSAITKNLRYDYGSIMHYDRYSFSKNGKITLVPKNYHYLKTLGQNLSGSFNDIKLINTLYCDKICKNKLRCFNQGYTDPNNCEICKCPRFYTGQFCEKLSNSDKSCPLKNLVATSSPKALSVHGKKNCYFQISTSNAFKIKITLVNSNLPYSDFCLPNKGLEIKFLLDKGVSGVLFCGKDKNKIIVSSGNVVTIHYAAFKNDQFFKIFYKKVNI